MKGRPTYHVQAKYILFNNVFLYKLNDKGDIMKFSNGKSKCISQNKQKEKNQDNIKQNDQQQSKPKKASNDEINIFEPTYFQDYDNFE